MTRTTNAELVEIALKIAKLAEISNALRTKAYEYPAGSMYRQESEKWACSLDDDICQLCTELRIACLPVSA